MERVELVFIPAPGVGHFVSTTEFAKSLLDRDEDLSITILIICLPDEPDVESQIQSVISSHTRIRCITITPVVPHYSSVSIEKFLSDFVESHKSNVEQAIMTKILSDDSVRLAGIVVDMFCTCMVDVAHKFKVPSNLFCTSTAAFLGFIFYLPAHYDRVGAEFDHSVLEIMVPSYANPVPTNVLPNSAFDKGGYTSFLLHSKRIRETRGFIINTLSELEPYAIDFLMAVSSCPIYAVGPLINLKHKEHQAVLGSEIMTWLDGEAPSSVLFLCFGSRGCFGPPQLEQIAMALESSGVHFLWLIRRPPPDGTLDFPSDYQNVQEALPEGFLERTKNRGRVCEWAPQVEVLAHPAIGGFVAHCGWNSCLESLWHGVPIATWPLYAEQQLNAFELVQELGLAVELKSDYRLGSDELVMADVIGRAITSLMAGDSPVRKKVKEMSETIRKAVDEGGSSASLGCFLDDMYMGLAASLE